MTPYRLLTIVSFLAFIAVGISSPLITLYLEALGADYAQISLILTTFVATVLLGNYLWGRFSDWLGRRKPILVLGLFGVAVSYALLSQVQSAGAAWATRLVEGLFMAAYTTLSLAIMGDILDSAVQASEKAGVGPQRGRLMGAFRGIGSLAFSVGALTGGRIADSYGLSSVFLVCAGLYAAAGIFALAVKDVPPPASLDAQPAPETAPAGPETRMQSHLPWFFLAGVLLWTAAHAASTSMWPNYMSQLGYTKTAIGSLWGLAAFVEMPAMYIVGTLSDSVGRIIMLVAGALGIAVVNLGYMLLATFWVLLLGIQVVRGFAFGSYTTSAMTFTSETGERRTRGTNSGIYFTAGNAGQLLGMSLGGTLVQLMGFHFLFGICALLALSSALCFWILRYRTKQVHSAPVSI